MHFVHILGKKIHQVAWGGGVRPEGRAHHVTGSMPPALVPVVGSISAQTGRNRLPKDNLTYNIQSMVQ